MRRFPAPPGGASTATGGPSSTHPLVAANRSAEAPMQYEWEQPRQFPTSLFATPQRGAHDAAGDGSERARKRTHYEAMDVDTPPPSSSGHVEPSSSSVRLEPLAFNPKKDFDRTEALGLNPREVREVVMADDAEDLVVPNRPTAPLRHGGGISNEDFDDDDDDDAKQLALTNLSRRRNARGTRKGRRDREGGGSRVTIETDDDDDDESDPGEDDARGLFGTLQRTFGTNKVGGSRGEFSFQVHHHHAPPAHAAGGVPQQTERWLQSNTPYVLLGYLQFGSLTLFALLVLSLLFLFVYTLYTDIQSRLASLTIELRQEILQCAKAYVDNRCEPATRIPAMERRCSDWEECMNREVVVTGKTRVVAETLAEIVNGFVDVISFKTMLFVLLTLGITIYGSSAALAVLSSRAASHEHASRQQQYHGAAPPPYGLPYGAGQTPWVIESGTGPSGAGASSAQHAMRLGPPPSTRDGRKSL